ncbi:hypothetical protein F0562_002263 [Nyssa sinensis]|uniref:Cytochrome P450 n=1 Tax=Nyssa sinensis TaxID=561372 RepID=A0A5J5C5T0_9ASTE|nr:hypothetical protein F0562_002263 [Nyssa sinensis]
MDLLPPKEAIGTLVALLLLYNLWRLRNFLSRAKKGKEAEAPEPRGAWPVIGHLHLLAGQTSAFRILASMAEKHGPIFTIRLGMRRVLVVSSKEAVMECFTKNDRDFLTRPASASSKYMGYDNALFGLGPSGLYWREIRKIVVSELLSNRRLELLKHVRTLEVDTCIKHLYSLCTRNGTGSTKADMSQWFGQVINNMILRMVAGKRYHIGEAENDRESMRFRKAIGEFMYLSGVFVLSDVIPHIEWLDLQGHVRSMKRIAEELEFFVGKWLEEHFKSRENGEKKKEECDFMDVMISLLAKHGLFHGHKSEDVIKATVLNLILAGSDTSSITLTWALSLLLNHNKVLKCVQEELDIHVGRERWVEDLDIKNLAYLQAIVKETLRLYPPGPLSAPREAMKDCYVSGYYVPKGTRLLVNMWKLHRDPSIWTDAFEFQPERFLTSNVGVDVRGQQFEYIPFSSGRRLCPGITSSLQMICLTLARLLQGFNLITPMNTQVDMSEGLGLSLPKATPLEVILTPRLPCKLYQQ